MAIQAPVILLPSGGADYTTDTTPQTLSGTTVADTEEIQVNGSTRGVSYTPGETAWSWTGELDLGANVIQVVAHKVATSEESSPAVINITLVQQDDFITVTSPTGVKLRRYQDKVEVVCTQNPEPNITGYNFYVSYQSGGTNNEYLKINDQLVTEPSFYEDVVTEISRTVNTVGEIRVTTITEEVKRVYYYSATFDEEKYNEFVQGGSMPDVGFNQEVNFFFISTAVIYDPLAGQVTESTYSPELEGTVISITTGIKDLPARTQSDIILTYNRELLAANPGIDMKPGTVMRDIVDPVSEETARVYVIQDFLARSLSISALLDFDDADGDGVSDPVSSSVPKKALQVALYLEDVDEVQRIIDDQFDKLAANVNVIRRGALPATGTCVFYIDTPPIRDMTVYEGAIVTSVGDVEQAIPSQSYKTLETKVLDYESRDQFYNTQTQRYELEVSIEAVNAGVDGNTDAYTIKSASSDVDTDFLVENPNPVDFGRDIESNQDLSARSQLALYADTGTEGGYARTAVGVQYVRGVRVEKAGDSLMWRDYDSVRQMHIGGKVDIYIEGVKTRQVEDKIAFAFSSGEGGQTGEQFQVINAEAFQFQTENTRVTAHTPIFEVSRVYNSTKAEEYDLSGYTIIGDGDTIDLDETLPANASIGLASADIIRVDYKYRSSDTFILQNQPVESVVSVVGQLSGELTTDNYELVQLEDPLQDGGSTIAHDGIRIMFSNNLPLTEFQDIVDESHVIIQGVNEELDYIGVDIESIVVTNSDKSVTYVRDVDYTVNAGTSTTSTSLRLIETGNITSGQTILVSYVAIENFTVTYTINSLLQDVQSEVNDMKHACADAIVKRAVQNPVDFIFTVVPKSGVANYEQLTSKIQTAVYNYITQLGVGISLSQSEVVHVIQKVDDVDYVVLPFTKMAKADGSFIVRDNIGTPTFQIHNEGISTAYITSIAVLTYPTIDKGGSENKFRGIFEDELPLVLQDDPLDVSEGPGRGYIQSDGKIIVSTRDGSLPDTKNYQVSYYVYGETGAEDIHTNTLEYLKVGSFTVTYDEPREVSRQSL